MRASNTQILIDVRDTMKMMLASAQSDNWHDVSTLDKQRISLLENLSNTEYTGDLELVDEIVQLDTSILESAARAKKELNEKIVLACRSKEVHNEYQTIADF